MDNEKVKLFVLLALCSISGNAESERQNRNSFPADFEFGTATSAYQIEGAWNTHGKGWSTWDYLVRTNQEHIVDQTNGDVAANSYYLYKRDVEMLKELGVNNYRFSIAWSRVMPYGRKYVNPEGIAYYNALIDELLANGITAFVTMFHWDLPQNLMELGGLLNDDFPDWFGDYVRVLYQNFGDRVKNWMTINEPSIHCSLGYGVGIHAPLIRDPGFGYYECGRNILLANARAYHIYKDEFKASQGGRVGFVVSLEWGMTSSDSKEAVEALQDWKAFHMDHFVHPIWSETGNYPQIMIDRVAAASAAQGLNSSRLRPFTEEQIAYMKGAADFLGVNHYVSTYVYRNETVAGMYAVPSIYDDAFVGTYTDPSWPFHGFNTEYPPGIKGVLLHMRDNYNNPLMYITENGCGTTNVGLNDDDRTGYYRGYLQEVANAVAEGANVKGYFAWSLMDNFEWAFGYAVRFGLYEVDQNHPNRTRTPRKSALVYKEIIRSKQIDLTYDPDPYAHLEEEMPSEVMPGGAASSYASASVVLLLVVSNLFMS
ncbi:glycosyl hydrolase family 1 domain-containing protein [Phthorimaea operculella]|nr:glycosyl hydrolase family 1 domain-containing protein [Phthorimaea operculella]